MLLAVTRVHALLPPTLRVLTNGTHTGFPDRGYFGYVSKRTHTPLRAIWLSTVFCMLPGLLDFASPVAANAIFSLTAIALDISYIIPIALRRIFQNHPEVQFKPGPFYLGDGLLGWAVNLNCIVWTLFVSVIFSLPTYLPVTKNTMNYASVITGSVVLLAMYAVTLSLFLPDSPADAIFLSPKDVVLRRVSGCIITKHETTDAELSLVAAVDITMGLMHMSRKKSRLKVRMERIPLIARTRGRRRNERPLSSAFGYSTGSLTYRIVKCQGAWAPISPLWNCTLSAVSPSSLICSACMPFI
jgi:hypothetical protein